MADVTDVTVHGYCLFVKETGMELALGSFLPILIQPYMYTQRIVFLARPIRSNSDPVTLAGDDTHDSVQRYNADGH